MAQSWFLVCESCGYGCLLQGSAARALADNPPACPGCRETTRVIKVERKPEQQQIHHPKAS